MIDSVVRWAHTMGIALRSPLDGATADLRPLSVLDEAVAGADLVFLGELNHFVHEKSDFRLLFARYLLSRGFGQFAEELGWSDGRRIERYLATGDAAVLESLSLFGCCNDLRTDRDDRPTGIFAGSFAAYPRETMRAEQERFYNGLMATGASIGYFAFDIDGLPGSGYGDIAALLAPFRGSAVVDAFLSALARTAGESAIEESRRLAPLKAAAASLAPLVGDTIATEVECAVAALSDSLDYIDRTYAAATYAATAPGMAFREECMKRRFADLRRLSGGAPTVVMSHALHLAKDDRLIVASDGVGPGGDRTSSIGHHLTRELGLKVFSIWMIYGGGEDSQPLPDLPRRAAFPADTLNAALAPLEAPTLLPVATAPPGLAERIWSIGHMYNAVVRTPLKGQADALFFLPMVSPMRR